MEKAPDIDYDSVSFKILAEPETQGVLKSIQDDYLYWDKVKYRKSPYKPEELWSAVKLNRGLTNKTIHFGKHTFTFHVTDFMQRALHQFDLNIGGTLTSNIGIAETDKTKYIISSLIEEAISSSQMEGAITTRKQAKQMIQKDLQPRNKSEKMILNNYRTMRYIVQNKTEPLNPDSLLNIHRLITKGTLDKKEDEGSFRKNNEIQVVNIITSEVVHTPPNLLELTDLINDICDFFNKKQENFTHPILKACIIHFMIGWVHPFVDGNGRTARALFYWYMLREGYWMTEFLSISRIIKDTKTQYEKAFLYTEIDDNDLNYFITYHIRMMERSFEALKKYIHKKQNEVVQAAKFLSIPNVNERMAQLIKILKEDDSRVFTTKEVEKRFEISNHTARMDLDKLVELDFLKKIPVNKIKRNFVKSKKFDTILAKYGI